MLNYGTFEAMPAVWSMKTSDAWVSYDNKEWREMPFTEVYNNARPMAEADWRAAFPDVPPLPKAALQAAS